MYERYWGLQRQPFGNSCDTAMFYRSESHQAAVLKLRYVLENRLGAGLLAGGVGFGKTYLTHVLAEETPERYSPVVRVIFPQMTAVELLTYIAEELGAEQPERGLDRVLRKIEEQFAWHAEQDRHPVLIIDDAHMIEDRQVFQTLHLLLNYQQQQAIEFSLLLLGEGSLLGQFTRLPQLDERIGIKSLLQPLTEAETAEYVRHRMAVAGRNEPAFEMEALHTLYELSGGVPRRINRLCDLALLVGFADRLSRITAGEIEAVAEELVAVVPD